jgi:hypothetical protein
MSRESAYTDRDEPRLRPTPTVTICESAYTDGDEPRVGRHGP